MGNILPPTRNSTTSTIPNDPHMPNEVKPSTTKHDEHRDTSETKGDPQLSRKPRDRIDQGASPAMTLQRLSGRRGIHVATGSDDPIAGIQVSDEDIAEILGQSKNTQALRSQPRTSTRTLSKSEKAMRASTYQPSDGCGFAFGSAKLSKAEAERFLSSLTAEQKATLGSTGAKITIWGQASGPGNPKFNSKLARQRAEALRALLQGPPTHARCHIEIKTTIAPQSRKDDASLRSARMETTISAKDAKLDLGVPKAKPIKRPPASSPLARPQVPLALPKDVRKAVSVEVARHGGKTPVDPFFVTDRGGKRYLILPNPDTNKWRGIATSNVPEGLSQLYGSFVRASGSRVTAARKYPETGEGISRVLSRKTTPLQRRRLAAANKLLNQRMLENLRKGMSMREAEYKRATDDGPFKAVLIKMAGAG